MLILITYDVSTVEKAGVRRLRRVARACSDYGVRVQYSLFECWLEDDQFEELWQKLLQLIEPGEDRLVAYVLDAAVVRKRLTAGEKMICTAKTTCYIV